MVEKRLLDIRRAIAERKEKLWKEIREYEKDLERYEKSKTPDDTLKYMDYAALQYSARTAIQNRMVELMRYENLARIINMLFEDALLWEITDLDVVVGSVADAYVKV